MRAYHHDAMRWVLILSLSGTSFAAVPPEIVKLALGWEHTCALFSTGEVKCWGQNSYGQLGLGDSQNRGVLPNEMGRQLKPLNLGVGRKVKDISAGAYYTCALLDNKDIKCWGAGGAHLGLGHKNTVGTKLSDMGDNLPPVNLGTNFGVRGISLGYVHSCVVFEDGRVKCWGQNDSGQLGLGDIKYRGNVPAEMGDALPFVNLGTQRKVLSLASGWSHTCALLDNLDVKCWGLGGPQLGLGHFETIGLLPNQMGDNLRTVSLGSKQRPLSLTGKGGHSCIVLEDREIKCWGQNFSGQLGLGISREVGSSPTDMGDNLPTLKLSENMASKEIFCAGINCCSILENNALKCWGDNSYGQLGLGDYFARGFLPTQMGDNLPYVDLGRFYKVRQVAVSGWHSCAVLEDEARKPTRLKCWGLNNSGQLGQGDKASRGTLPSDMGDRLPDILLF